MSTAASSVPVRPGAVRPAAAGPVARQVATEADWQRWGGLSGLPEWQPGPPGRVVVVAAHPDDETFGAGATLHELGRRGWRVEIVLVTDGEAAPAPRLAGRLLVEARGDELAAALDRLGLGDARVHRLHLPDAGVDQHTAALVRRLRPLVEAADLILCPHPADGHRDHDAAGGAAATVAAAAGVPCLAFGVWLWTWSRPGDPRHGWARAVAVPVTDRARAARTRAVAAYGSQVGSVVPPTALGHHDRDAEVLFALTDLPADAAHAPTADGSAQHPPTGRR